MYNLSTPYPYPYPYSYPYFIDAKMYTGYSSNFSDTTSIYDWDFTRAAVELKDYGKRPFVINIDEASKQNDTFRTALWTGEHLQVTLMSINVGE